MWLHNHSARWAPEIAVSRRVEQQTVGAELEQVRLESRARRLERLLESLRRHERAVAPGTAEGTMARRAVVDFPQERERVRERLSQIRGSAPTPPDDV